MSQSLRMLINLGMKHESFELKLLEDSFQIKIAIASEAYYITEPTEENLFEALVELSVRLKITQALTQAKTI